MVHALRHSRQYSLFHAGEALRNFQPREMATIKKALSKFDTSGGLHDELRFSSFHSSRHHPIQNHHRPSAMDAVTGQRGDRKQPAQQPHLQLLLPRLQRHRRGSEGHGSTVTSSDSFVAGLRKSLSEQSEFDRSSQVSVGHLQPKRFRLPDCSIIKAL
jgi:hypothetical protein